MNLAFPSPHRHVCILKVNLEAFYENKRQLCCKYITQTTSYERLMLRKTEDAIYKRQYNLYINYLENCILSIR